MEAGKELVDLLLSFLILPTGTVLQLFQEGRSDGAKSLGAAITNVYTSFQKLDNSSLYVHNDVLLKQKAVCAALSELPNSAKRQLQIDLEPPRPSVGDPMSAYRCNCSQTFKAANVCNLVCTSCDTKVSVACTMFMEVAPGPSAASSTTTEPEKPGKGGFVKKKARFLVTDDLHIKETSMLTTFGLLSKLKVEKMTDLESIKISMGPSQVLPSNIGNHVCSLNAYGLLNVNRFMMLPTED